LTCCTAPRHARSGVRAAVARQHLEESVARRGCRQSYGRGLSARLPTRIPAPQRWGYLLSTA
jgi:hypothetical protein